MASQFRTLKVSNEKYEPEGLRFAVVRSKHLKGRGDVTLFIPPQIKKIDRHVPIVILLHGVYGSHWAWTYSINVHRIATRLMEEGRIPPMVLVMPSDGLLGDGSGYFQHADKDYEKWIVKDVVSMTKEVVPYSGSGQKIFIAGLSMGGYGALRLMAKYPLIFSGASGLSSITSLKDFLPFLSREEQRYFRETFGDEELITYLKKNKKKLPPFRLDCGTGDKLIKSNRFLHQQLEAAGIPHTYNEFDGGHNNEYWTANIDKTLMYFSGL